MDKKDVARLDLILSTMHLLNAAMEGMSSLDHKPEARSLHAMVRTLSKDIDKVVKGGDGP